METREYKAELNLVEELQALIESFPAPALRGFSEKNEKNRMDFALRLKEDFQTHHNNQMIIDRIADECERAAEGALPLKAAMVAQAKDLVNEANELQNQFRNEVFEEISMFKGTYK